KLGLVASLARPGGNLTGINFFTGELGAKQLGLLRELVPGAARIAALINPANVQDAATAVAEVEVAARTMGLQIQVFNASIGRELNTAFAAVARERSDALFIGATPISPSGGYNLQPWRRAMRFLHCMSRVTFPKPAV